MPRRSKQEAEQTRAQILHAARRVFHQNGVSQTTLEQIAQAAGVTRGAIYWHFSNKRALLQAMCDEVAIPFIDSLDDTLLQDEKTDALSRIRNFLLQLTNSVENNHQLRTIMQIMEFKCEFVGERTADLEDWKNHNQELLQKLTQTYQKADAAGTLRPDCQPDAAALDTLCFLIGLIRLQLLGQPCVQGSAAIRFLIDTHIRSKMASSAVDPRPAAQ